MTKWGALFKRLFQQCETDEDIRTVLLAVNAFYEHQDRTDPIRRAKARRQARLGHHPREALEAKGTGRITIAEVRKYLDDNNLGHLLPQGYEDAAIERNLSKNLGRTWQRYPNGEWGLIHPNVHEPKVVPLPHKLGAA